MKAAIRRLLLFLPVLLVLLFAGAYLLAGAWLESRGGREAIEQQLSRRLGVPVNLQGDFSIALLPSVGVAGTELVIGEPGTAAELGRSAEYAVELAVRPLLRGTLVVESFSLAGGRLYLARLPPRGGADRVPDGNTPPPGLPDIGSFTIRDFEIVTADDSRFLLQEFSLEGFEPGRPAPFRLAVADYGALAGTLDWRAATSELLLSAAWSDYLPGLLQLRLRLGLAAGAGDLEADWSPPGTAATAPAVIRMAAGYEYRPGGIGFAGFRLDAGAQYAAGEGCLLLGDVPALHLDLASPQIDFDALPDLSALAALGGEEEEGAATDSVLSLNLRLRAAEARGAGAVAREAVLQAGGEPDCSGL
ncbi:MAG: hypothetical protein ACSLE2_00630 [Lysobacterales bacterium]